MTHPLLTQFDETVFVGSLASAIRSMRPQLRMDGQNGMHKIMWLSKGNGRVMIDGATKGIGPNTIVFIPASTPHVIEVGINTYGTFIALDPSSRIDVPRRGFIYPVLNIMKQAETTKYIDSIVGEASSEVDGRFMAIEAYISLLVVHILRMVGDSFENKKETASQKLMRKFTRTLESQFRSSHSLNDYADVLGVTTTHLSRVSRELNSKSAGQLIQDRLLSEAMHMLLYSNKKVQEISADLGFNSPAYFTRLFNSKLNQTPKDYRKSRARGPEEMQRIRARGL